MSPAGIAGCAATGRSPPGCCRGCAGGRASASAIRSPPCRGGRSSTTCAAAWCRWPCCWCCSSRGSSRRPWRRRRSLFVASVVLLPALLAAAADLLRKPVDLPLGMHLRATLQSLGRPLAQGVLTFVFLPYEAYISADAIVRTLVRMVLDQAAAARMEDGQRFGTRRRRQPARTRSARWRSRRRWPPRRCWCSLFYDRQVLLFAGPWIAAWMASPLVAWWLSRPIPQAAAAALREPAALSREAVAEDVAVLRGVRHGGRQLAAAGQHPAESRPGGRAAHQSDEHRHGVAGRPGGLRFRLLLGRAVA